MVGTAKVPGYGITPQRRGRGEALPLAYHRENIMGKVKEKKNPKDEVIKKAKDMLKELDQIQEEYKQWLKSGVGHGNGKKEN